MKTAISTVQGHTDSRLWQTIQQKLKEENSSIQIEIFIDHNPKRFEKVLDCLRDNEMPTYFANPLERAYLMKDLNTFGPFNLETLKCESSSQLEQGTHSIYIFR